MNISAEKIVIAFFIIAVVVSVSGLAGMGITFIIRMRQNEISAEKEDEEYRFLPHICKNYCSWYIYCVIGIGGILFGSNSSCYIFCGICFAEWIKFKE